MKAILMSIKPEECEKIFSGVKTSLEIKPASKLNPPFKVYAYQTKSRRGNKVVNEVLDAVYGGGKVVGEFVCDNVGRVWSCLWFDNMFSYLGVKGGAALHITEPRRYDTPKELSEFRKVCLNGKCSDCIYEECKIIRPPQSWCYVEEVVE